MRACGAGEKILDRAFAVRLAHFDLVALVAADDVEVLGQRDQPRARRRRGSDQPRRGLEIGTDLGRGNHLHRSNARLAQGFAVSLGVVCTATFATFGSTQLPVTSNSCAKIWPSGFLSTRCASAAATPATGLTIASAVDAVPPSQGTAPSGWAFPPSTMPE